MDSGSELYARFLAGEQDAMTAIIRDYSEGLMLYLASIVGSLWTAEELAEDTFVRLVTRKPRDRRRGSFKTWLYTIGHNLAVDWLRKNKRPPEIPLEQADEYAADCAHFEERFFRRERDRILHSAMQSLRPDYRQILWLLYFGQLSMKEAAAVMRRSVHAAEMLASRARRALREQLTEEGLTYEDLSGDGCGSISPR